MAPQNPSTLTGDLIRTVAFDRVADGYDPEHVTAFLSKVADQLEAVPEPVPGDDQARGERISEQLIAAARTTAAEILGEAHASATKTGADAADEAERLLAAAIEQAEGILARAEADVAERLAAQEAQLVEVSDRVVDAEQKLTTLVLDRNSVLSDLDQVISDVQVVIESNRARTPQLGAARLVQPAGEPIATAGDVETVENPFGGSGEIGGLPSFEE